MTTPQSSDPIALLGQWTLTGFYEEDAGHRDGSYVHIFQNTSAYAADKFNDASGETLSVTDTDGEVTFKMRGGAQVPWTSAEKEQGVLNATIEDLDGRVVASIHPFFRMERLVNDRWKSKYSDSDLDMDNLAFSDDGTLVLMVTTIVDELYVTKYFYRFART